MTGVNKLQELELRVSHLESLSAEIKLLDHGAHRSILNLPIRLYLKCLAFFELRTVRKMIDLDHVFRKRSYKTLKEEKLFLIDVEHSRLVDLSLRIQSSTKAIFPRLPQNFEIDDGSDTASISSSGIASVDSMEGSIKSSLEGISSYRHKAMSKLKTMNSLINDLKKEGNINLESLDAIWKLQESILDSMRKYSLERISFSEEGHESDLESVLHYQNKFVEYADNMMKSNGVSHHLFQILDKMSTSDLQNIIDQGEKSQAIKNIAALIISCRQMRLEHKKHHSSSVLESAHLMGEHFGHLQDQSPMLGKLARRFMNLYKVDERVVHSALDCAQKSVQGEGDRESFITLHRNIADQEGCCRVLSSKSHRFLQKKSHPLSRAFFHQVHKELRSEMESINPEQRLSDHQGIVIISILKALSSTGGYPLLLSQGKVCVIADCEKSLSHERKVIEEIWETFESRLGDQGRLRVLELLRDWSVGTHSTLVTQMLDELGNEDLYKEGDIGSQDYSASLRVIRQVFSLTVAIDHVRSFEKALHQQPGNELLIELTRLKHSLLEIKSSLVCLSLEDHDFWSSFIPVIQDKIKLLGMSVDESQENLMMMVEEFYQKKQDHKQKAVDQHSHSLGLLKKEVAALRTQMSEYTQDLGEAFDELDEHEFISRKESKAFESVVDFINNQLGFLATQLEESLGKEKLRIEIDPEIPSQERELLETAIENKQKQYRDFQEEVIHLEKGLEEIHDHKQAYDKREEVLEKNLATFQGRINDDEEELKRLSRYLQMIVKEVNRDLSFCENVVDTISRREDFRQEYSQKSHDQQELTQLFKTYLHRTLPSSEAEKVKTLISLWDESVRLSSLKGEILDLKSFQSSLRGVFFKPLDRFKEVLANVEVEEIATQEDIDKVIGYTQEYPFKAPSSQTERMLLNGFQQGAIGYLKRYKRMNEDQERLDGCSKELSDMKTASFKMQKETHLKSLCLREESHRKRLKVVRNGLLSLDNLIPQMRLILEFDLMKPAREALDILETKNARLRMQNSMQESKVVLSQEQKDLNYLREEVGVVRDLIQQLSSYSLLD